MWRLLARTGIMAISMPSSAADRVRSRRTRVRRGWNVFHRRLRRWRKRARWARRRLNAAPLVVRVTVIAAALLTVFSAANLVYQVMRKPTEMLFPVSNALNKAPAETWRQYAPLFREYSTAAITPELLAALAHFSGAGPAAAFARRGLQLLQG